MWQRFASEHQLHFACSLLQSLGLLQLLCQHTASGTCYSLALPGEAIALAPATQMACMLQGLFEFRFQLVYTSLEEQLVKIKELWDLALRQKGKERDAQNSAKQRLSAIIQACPPLPSPCLPCCELEPTCTTLPEMCQAAPECHHSRHVLHACCGMHCCGPDPIHRSFQRK